MIGVVGADGSAAHWVETFESADEPVETGTADDVLRAGPDSVVAVGEPALVDLVGAGVDVPVFPVGIDQGLPTVTPEEVPGAIAALEAGRARLRDHPLLAVELADEDVGRAAFDVMLVRGDPGRISEYDLEAGDARSHFRADGVVVATPIGSHGYARAAGGPRLGPDVATVSVVPVAAFGLGTPVWVLDPVAGIALTVAHGQGEVSLLLDGREHRSLVGRSTVTVSPGGTFQTVIPPDG